MSFEIEKWIDFVDIFRTESRYTQIFFSQIEVKTLTVYLLQSFSRNSLSRTHDIIERQFRDKNRVDHALLAIVVKFS
jgi:hypothetical protein